MKYFTLLFAVLFLLACTQKEKKADQKKIVKNDSISISYEFDTASSKLDFLYYDEFYDQIKIEFNRAITKKGSHLIKSSQPIFLLDYSLNQTYYVIYSGERILFKPSLGIKDSIPVEIERKDSVRQNEVLFFERLAKFEAEDVEFLQRIKKITAHTSKDKTITDRRFWLFLEVIKMKKMENTALAFRQLKAKYGKRTQFLNEYGKQHHISPDFEKLVRDFFIADFESDYFQMVHQALVKKKKIEPAIESMMPSIIQHLNVDTNFFIPSVTKRLLSYLDYCYSKLNIRYAKDKIAFINTNLKGEIRKKAEFLTIKTMTLEKTTDELVYLSNFAKINPGYSSYIHQNLMPQEVNDSKTILLDSKGTAFNFDKLLKAHKGKVLLLDFWASWCSPCIAEFPSSKKIKDKLASEELVFIYFSIDENFNIWNKSATQFNLGENSYLIKNQGQSGLVKKLKIESIPRYVIINAKGEIVNSKAERPSSGILEKQLLSYLIRK